MSRLYGINYNKDQWVIKGSLDEGSLTIVNKLTYDSYSVYGNIIGIEQISDSSFLVYKRTQRYNWKIERLRFFNSKIYVEFEKDFENFTFLSDDTILFDSDMVYSISNNYKVDEFDWIKQYNVKLYDSLIDDNKSYLLVEGQTSFGLGRDNTYVYVIVDCKEFKPISSAYSSLRNSYISLSDNFTFDDLVAEDTYYAHIIEDYIFTVNISTKRVAIDLLLSQAERYGKN